MSAEPTAESASDARAILERRAERLARVKTVRSGERTAEQIAVIEVGRQRVGLPTARLRELLARPPLARVPGLPAWIPGIVQIRGELMCVIDLGRRLGIESDAEPLRMAVLAGSRGPVGILAHRVVGFRDVAQDELAETYVGSDAAGRRFVRAITRDLVTILDTDTLLDDAELTVDLRTS